MKALPCRICATAANLRWMNHGGAEWWIHCDGCGATGAALPTKADAGEAWNNQQQESPESWRQGRHLALAAGQGNPLWRVAMDYDEKTHVTIIIVATAIITAVTVGLMLWSESWKHVP